MNSIYVYQSLTGSLRSIQVYSSLWGSCHLHLRYANLKTVILKNVKITKNTTLSNTFSVENAVHKLVHTTVLL